ncbi:hypothetical protein JTY93_11950 [Pseudomonas hygromyciniae]|uniref:LysR family transcriptional regulator n=1 Tax=Pseudomonas hygromyciniae TaxID=2812000 RepID=A0ABX7K458_9PSED|nr:hypothetical protein [Pseudomonas hygromyciniae]MBN0976914.1 hypothetical protein [Pseudomonas hygromyciniae]QSB42440.1 hypothetical protein JTY93_11950 [Pseudomonas hygromyciniae]
MLSRINAAPKNIGGPAHDVQRPLAPKVVRQIGLAVLDRRQSSAATLAFIQMAQRLTSVFCNGIH